MQHFRANAVAYCLEACRNGSSGPDYVRFLRESHSSNLSDYSRRIWLSPQGFAIVPNGDAAVDPGKSLSAIDFEA